MPDIEVAVRILKWAQGWLTRSVDPDDTALRQAVADTLSGNSHTITYRRIQPLVSEYLRRGQNEGCIARKAKSFLRRDIARLILARRRGLAEELWVVRSIQRSAAFALPNQRLLG
jgi:hypothetical protein